VEWKNAKSFTVSELTSLAQGMLHGWLGTQPVDETLEVPSLRAISRAGISRICLPAGCLMVGSNKGVFYSSMF
jgi:hypothetical protein